MRVVVEEVCASQLTPQVLIAFHLPNKNQMGMECVSTPLGSECGWVSH